MKIIYACVCLVFVLLVHAESIADTYRANGDVCLVDSQTNREWKRRIFSAVVSEEPMVIEQSGYVVTMVFTIEPPASINYSLNLSLKTNPEAADEVSTTLFSKTYEATLVGGANGPLEFEFEQNGLRFGGAVALNLRKRR